MFQNYLKLVFRPNNLMIIRNYVPRGRQPGITKRMKYFKEDIEDNFNDPEMIVTRNITCFNILINNMISGIFRARLYESKQNI